VGRSFGPTDWLVVEQSRIDQFADATGDHQWIHVDVERAASGPFGGTIAHGYLTLALVNLFLPQLLQAEGAKMGVNYGLRPRALSRAPCAPARACVAAPRSSVRTMYRTEYRSRSALRSSARAATSRPASPTP
jgi:hypothetical protein